ncbi:hypothetical protein C8J56DRAFT_881349 [Mycena floridula]|nr:hypothetical protein C8J56DRAFT_881349 [Mycena floridula]
MPIPVENGVDNRMANIDAVNQGIWDAYIPLHPGALPFRNKGWPLWDYMSRMMLTQLLRGANVYNPMQIVVDSQASGVNDSQASDESDDIKPVDTSFSQDWDFSQLDRDFGRSSSPRNDTEDEVVVVKQETKTPAKPVLSRKRVSAIPSDEEHKRQHISSTPTSSGAKALAEVGKSLKSFTNVFAKAFAAPADAGPLTQPQGLQWQPETPRKVLKDAIAKVQKLEKGWMSIEEMIKLLAKFRKDSLATTTYLSLADSDDDFRMAWIRAELEMDSVA